MGQKEAPDPKAASLWGEVFYRIRFDDKAAMPQFRIETRAGQSIGLVTAVINLKSDDFRVYSDQGMEHEVLRIKRRRRILFPSAPFHVTDSKTGDALGVFRRTSPRSILRKKEKNTYEVQRASGHPIGCVRDAKSAAPPQRMVLEVGGQRMAEMREVCVGRMRGTWEMDCVQSPQHIDRKLMLAAFVLSGIVESADVVDRRESNGVDASCSCF